MAAKAFESLQFSVCLNSDKTMRKPYNPWRFSQGFVEQQRVRSFVSCSFHPRKDANCRKPFSLKGFPVLPRMSKNKAEEVVPYLNGRCIYLVGMMGSGKTTIGRVLSEVIGYSFFFDSDRLIESAVGGTSVAVIFKLHGESFFRENEIFLLNWVMEKYAMSRQLIVNEALVQIECFLKN